MKRRISKMRWVAVAILLAALGTPVAHAESVARQWNEALLDAIRGDLARPTVHARNLFHSSLVMYDAWAAYDGRAVPYLLGMSGAEYSCPFSGVGPHADVEAAREEAISYAAYRLLKHRFARSPGAEDSMARFDELFSTLGYDPQFDSVDYQNGSPAALGNYIAQCMITFGLQDGANEENDYASIHYEPVNEPLVLELPGNPSLSDPNRWQPIAFETFIDQSGNVFEGNVPEFVSPEWGRVVPFALRNDDLSIKARDGYEYWVYHDPGPPPYLNPEGTGLSADYHWGFELVALWSSHLDPSDGVMWDISPGAIGNIPAIPATPAEYRAFYDELEGGDPSLGHPLNPRTGEPYEPQIVPRGDYTRVLAEFWADGPDSETPPGHWFTILNYVSDHPEHVKRFAGRGRLLDDLEWDVKSYFVLGGAVHDSAVASWGIKGWYDYVRPVSVVRYMSDRGQRTDPSLPNYSPQGFALVPGMCEIVEPGDPLAGAGNRNVGKIKIRAWRGPNWVDDPETDEAGVDWILASTWWPYQRPTFVTPPFAGYISGHSTFSRAASVVMALVTGDEFFPGGLGEFHAGKNEFLVFEEGPSVDVTLQWATYEDASDQTSLSRIWGGIHPPADDIPGRRIGEKIGHDAYELAVMYFSGCQPSDSRVCPGTEGRRRTLRRR